MTLSADQMNTAEEACAFFAAAGCTDAGIAGLLGNIYAESHLRANCVEELLLKRYREESYLVWTDTPYDPENYARYAACFAAGVISREEFLSPRQYTGKPHQYGFGLCQWTTRARKERLLALADDDDRPIDDVDLQLGLIYLELTTIWKSVWQVLTTTDSVSDATKAVLTKYECPANAEALLDTRTGYAEELLKILKGVNAMNIIFGSARIAEDGTVNGTRPGDNTGAEVSTQMYYKHRKGWKVLRANSADAANKIASAMAAACANAHIGYSQARRYTGVTLAKTVGWSPARIANACDVDCSSLVRICVAYGTSRDPGDFDTGSERAVLLATGLFSDVTWGVNQNTGAGLCNGDILVTRSKGHTGVIVSGATVRSTSTTAGTNTADKKGAAYMFSVQQIYEGCPASNSVYLAQEILKSRGIYTGALDKEFGPQMAAAVLKYQRIRHLEADRIVGPATWKDMLGL